MKKFLLMISVLMVIAGCATTHETFKYAGSQESMANGISVYYQLEMSYIKEVKGKNVVIAQPIPMNRKFILPKTVNGVAFGLYIKNTKLVEYEIWEEYELLQDKNTEPYYIKRRLNKSRLPSMVQSIILPLHKGTEVVYKVEIVSAGGVKLFTIGNAQYSVGAN